jgi:hypothetical protein
MIDVAMCIDELNWRKIFFFYKILQCFFFCGKIATGVNNNRVLIFRSTANKCFPGTDLN